MIMYSTEDGEMRLIQNCQLCGKRFDALESYKLRLCSEACVAKAIRAADIKPVEVVE